MGSTSWPFNAEGPVLSKMLDGVCHGIMVKNRRLLTIPCVFTFSFHPPKKKQGASYVVIPFVLPLRWNHPILCAPSRNTQAQNAADFACTQASTGAQNAVDVIGIGIVFFQRFIRLYLVFIRLWDSFHHLFQIGGCVCVCFHPSDGWANSRAHVQQNAAGKGASSPVPPSLRRLMLLT